MSSRKDEDTMNRLMRVTLLTFVVSLVVWGLVAVWDADPRALTSWMLTWQRIAVYVATVSGLLMLALLVYAAWSAQTLEQTCAVPVSTGIRDPHFRRAPDRLRGGSSPAGGARRDAVGRRPEHVGRYMAATVTPVTFRERTWPPA
jgi:hypothetical protein